MSLAELLHRDCIWLDYPARTREETLGVLVSRLAELDILTAPDEVVHALLEREKVMSTGIGGGVAIPHAQHSSVRRLTVVLARPVREVDFEALDGRPVRLIFMIVGPEERGGFIRILARISRLLYAGELQKRLLKARSPEEVMKMVLQEEEKLKMA